MSTTDTVSPTSTATDTVLPPPATPSGTIFFAVPVKAKTADSSVVVEKCLYFDVNGVPVDSQNLQAAKNEAFVRVQQMSFFLPQPVREYIDRQGYVGVTNVSLFSAVAKTLDGTADMPNTFLARGSDESPFVTIPVAPDTQRGLVLVFLFSAPGLPQKLLPTADPIVKGGSST